MAFALGKVGKLWESVEFLERYAEKDGGPDSLNMLALAYVNLQEYEQAERIFEKMTEQSPDSYVALFGMAQLAYKQEKGYKSILDRIHKMNPEWLEEKLKSDWDFKLPGLADDEENMWNAATASRYLGFDRPFDLTRRAFNDEIPSYFDSERGTIRFIRSELDNWVELMNRYNINGGNLETFEEKLLPQEIEKGKRRRGRPKKSKSSKSGIDVENNTVVS
jgi:tetratricopeptide (TPR) repeat protein